MISIDILPVIVTDLPDDEDHAPLLVDPAAARIVRADQVAAGDTVLASFPDYGPRQGMLRTDYFNDQYTAQPVPYRRDRGCCESCASAPGCNAFIVNLGDVHWDECDLWQADAL
ncbi:hypothetical protein ABZ454_38925, partial [Streptomyces sp. NPDC005803]|uniref:hypothetical protein n=1 Tax=Streptomyces sp. NPDC005803 TaxID=3154297 RepID=UPI003411F624